MYDAVMMMSEPALLPPAGGHTVLLLVQVLNGLQVTSPALDFRVTFNDDAGIPTANPDMVEAIWPTVMAQPVPAQPAPRVATIRDAAFTASARL